MAVPAAPSARCGIDTVEIARIERLLRETPVEDLAQMFSPVELAESGTGPGRAASLAARFAAKEACLKLFHRETSLGLIGAADFAVVRDSYGAPQVVPSPAAADVLGRHRMQSISLSLTHDKRSAMAMAMPVSEDTEVPAAGWLLYRLLPFRRRVVLENLRRVYTDVADAGLERLAAAHYAHLGRLFLEFIKFPWLSQAQRAAMVRVENAEAFLAAQAQRKGTLVLTGHFGNWEVATVAGIGNFPRDRGRFHFVRRPFKPRWLDAFVTRRFRRAGFGVFPKRGALEAILERLEAGEAIVFPFDQHASGRDAVQVDFFGYPAGTFRSLAIIALASGAPVVPASSWREPGGMHVLRFEEALQVIECEDTNEAIRRNTRAYNAALERMILRHPEQWFWVHRRWKGAAR